jgi:glucose-1-phosphate cytidylyltransferase
MVWAIYNINQLIKFHKEQNTLATITATQPAGHFGTLLLNNDKKVTSFKEKPQSDGAWINGGFFVLSPKVLDYIEGDDTIWERQPLESLAKEGQISAFLHDGFW